MKNKILLLIAVATLGLTAKTMAQVPSYIPTNGLVGYWPFNGNANDESGNGNNGTVNGATSTSDRNGNANSAYNFDGNADYIVIPNSNSLNPNSISFSFWVLFNNGNCGVLSKSDSITTDNYGYSIIYNFQNQNTGLFTGWNTTGSCTYPYSNGGYTFGSSNNIQSNIWQHVVVTIDNNGQCKQYVNGVATYLYTHIPLNSCNSTSSLLHLGRQWFGDPCWLNGKLDDLGIWNRALTQQEITDLYNSCQLSVSTQPASQTININNNAQFIVGSSDTNATYQWQTDLGLGFQNISTLGQYSGTTNDTLSVANVAMNNDNQLFRCITNSGSCTDTSNVAVLTINNNVGIHEMAQHNLFSVFPNPAHNIINVKADHKLIGSVFTIYDNTGKAVQSGKINAANTTIELSNLSGGVYLFSIGDNMKQTFKLIKE